MQHHPLFADWIDESLGLDWGLNELSRGHDRSPKRDVLIIDVPLFVDATSSQTNRFPLHCRQRF
jgi:hypothetical protein